MSNKSTILLTDDLGEHWHFDCSFYSPKGRFDIFIQIDQKNIVEMSYGSAFRNDAFFYFQIVEDCDIYRHLNRTKFEIPLSDIKGIHLDDEGLEIHVCGDSEVFLKSLFGHNFKIE